MSIRDPFTKLVLITGIFIFICAILAAAAFAATPAFTAHKNGTNQTVVNDADTLLTWSTEGFDTNNNFATNRFTPTVAGKYLIVVSVHCQQAGSCMPAIRKNGTTIVARAQATERTVGQTPSVTAIVDMNGTTDYVEAMATSSGTVIAGTIERTYFSGSQIDGAGSGSSQWIDGSGGAIYYNSGNVGIGTTAPQSTLDLGLGTNGRSIVWGGNTGVNHYASIGTTYSSGALSLARGLKLATGGADQYLYSYATGTRAGIRIGGGSVSDISFFSEPAATQTVDAPFDYVANTKMTIKENGNVGIGTTTPSTALHVDIGAAGGIGRIQISDSTAPDGYMGVGEGGSAANTFFPLFIARPSAATGFVGYYSEVLTANDTGTVPVTVFVARQSPTAAVATRPLFDWRNNATSMMTMLANGNVGIGTTSPQFSLDVIGTLASRGSSSQLRLIETDGADPADAWHISMNSGGLALIYADASGGPAYTDALYLAPNGNVGIGTTTPGERLDLGGGNISMGYQSISCAPGVCSTTSGRAHLSCPAGKQIITGGCDCGGGTHFQLRASYPGGGNAWNCICGQSGSGQATATVFATCANIR